MSRKYKKKDIEWLKKYLKDSRKICKIAENIAVIFEVFDFKWYNSSSSKFEVPDKWAIKEVLEDLILDLFERNVEVVETGRLFAEKIKEGDKWIVKFGFVLKVEDELEVRL